MLFRDSNTEHSLLHAQDENSAKRRPISHFPFYCDKVTGETAKERKELCYFVVLRVQSSMTGMYDCQRTRQPVHGILLGSREWQTLPSDCFSFFVSSEP